MSDDMDDGLRGLVEFLRARIDEDERAARTAAHPRATDMGRTSRWAPEGMTVQDEEGDLVVKHSWPHEVEHIARHDPARVLAEVEWKRSIIARCVRAMDRWGSDSEYSVGEHVMDALAAMYADHPDYRPEWKPHRWHLPAEHGEGVVR